MLEITSPSQFTVIPWKNGLGRTVEMAISKEGTVDSFDWRISQATVANDGEFSDFSGIERNLVLIKGEGISLLHRMPQQTNDNSYCQEDHLNELLDYANFDGGYKTLGQLHNGEIIDLNIMSAADKYLVDIVTAKQARDLPLPKANLVFVYSLSAGLTIKYAQQENVVEDGALLKVVDCQAEVYSVSGQQVIIAAFNEK